MIPARLSPTCAIQEADPARHTHSRHCTNVRKEARARSLFLRTNGRDLDRRDRTIPGCAGNRA